MWIKMEQNQREKKPKIYIDSNEPKIYQQILKELGAEVEQKKLDVGDFVLSENVVVERKTKADFISSIIDQRVFEQAKKMENYPIKLIVVEEDGTFERINKNALYGAYGCLVVDFKISLFFSKSPTQTCQILYSIAKYEQVSKKFQFRQNPIKKGRDLAQNQLALVESLPAIGSKIAKELLKTFKTPIDIFFATEKELEKVKLVGKERAKQLRNVLDSVYK
ncbi:MAG: helix-hairpin-helix domain-containing protein [Candidatus Micrarchaeota archaeon]|nr:helix-hairpin-helix domain-containing protein [Candidatus Micrarchaeota archaeon]